ncbi:MAG: MoxR family ATPase [Clostridia bacterium]|nr:MoxR family ATPase [Clostridia bacterium]
MESRSSAIVAEIQKAIVGKSAIIQMTLCALLSKGHVLLEDVPGVGKTTLALAFSKALALNYGRVQFTPDVLPSDIVGFSVYNKETKLMEYRPGAVLCNLFLADELNRATSRTQSALLEAMEESQITVDGNTYPLPQPFFVIATQNPTGASGTQLLPDSQMDRFMVRLSLGYPSPQQEVQLLARKQAGNMLASVKQVVSHEEFLDMQRRVESVYLHTSIFQYIVNLTNATRTHGSILQGASPRASIAVVSMAKAAAFLSGRDYVLPEDVIAIFPVTIEHRLILTPEAETSGTSAAQVLAAILKSISPPRIK